MRKIFIAGIGTDVGKTVVSAIITEALEADYWKPIQAGNLNETDTQTVQKLISNKRTTFHPESYRFMMPASPHHAAASENIVIEPDTIKMPETSGNIVVEGAGGLMVPLTNNFLIIDLIKKLECEVILVSCNYLGSINHTLMSVECLKSRGIPIIGLVFNGEPTPASEDFIITNTGLKKLPAVLPEPVLNPGVIKQYASRFKPILQ